MAEVSLSGSRRAAKSAAAFRTISEVAEELDVPQHVLRFWESKFTQVKPLKRGGGRRYYRPEDVLLLRRIRQCLYDEGYTIKGVQRLMREGALKAASTKAPIPAAPPPATPPGELALGLPAAPQRTDRRAEELRRAVVEVRRELMELRELLRQRG
jgi:DNA-binding transcriptional MerR regulator